MSRQEKLPNQLFYLSLRVCEEILGKNGLVSILNFAGLKKFIGNYPPNDFEMVHDFKDFTRMATTFVEVLGERGARAIMFQAGKRGFSLMVEVAPTLFNIGGVKPEELTTERKFDEFLKMYKIMTDASVAIFGDVYTLLEQEVGMIFEISPCYMCVDMKTENEMCYIQTGFMYGAAVWMLGEETKVEEVLCMAKGDDRCRFVVHRPKD
jgi:predicted hydrocarbon binding protein